LRKFNLKKEENVPVFIKKNSWTKKIRNFKCETIARNNNDPTTPFLLYSE